MRNPAFTALIREIEQLHETKNHDYAENGDPLSNLRRSEMFGIPAWKGVLVRLSDKWSRMEQLASGKTAKHESLRDSLVDNAVYSLLAVLLLDEIPAAPQLKISDCRTCGRFMEHGHDCQPEAMLPADPEPFDLATANVLATVENYTEIERTEGGFGFVPAAHQKMRR